MKTKTTITLALLLIVIATTGCGSTATSVKAETYCYKAVDATARVVDVGMSAAGDAYHAGLVSDGAKDRDRQTLGLLLRQEGELT